jgi:hypothetical protein
MRGWRQCARLGLVISWREATYWLILTYSWCLQLINLFDLSWQ